MDNANRCAWDDECPRAVVARGLCNTHYMRAKRSNTLDQWKAPQRECFVCGTLFDITKHRKACCSPECTGRRAGYELALRRLASLPDRACVQCGDPISTSVRRDARFCSVSCQQASWYGANDEELRTRARVWADNNEGRRRAYRHYRRALMRAVAYETFDAWEIGERDGWACAICSEPVDPGLAYPDRLSKSIDHIIPLSKGGSHTRENVAITHLTCNVRKRDRLADSGGDEPLALAT